MGRTLTGPLLAIAASAIVVSGCTNSRLGTLNTQPTPLTPAPTGQVATSQLPPPVQPGTGAPTIGPDGFPIAPGQTDVMIDDTTIDGTTDPADGTDPASGIQQVATAEPVTPEAMVGSWRVAVEGTSCQAFMSLTRRDSSWLAGSRGCPGETADIRTWTLTGNQVVLSDSGGNRVATLFSSGNERFDGQTVGGRAISLAR